MAGFGSSTLIVVVVLGTIAFIIGWRRPFAVLSALILLIPFRDLSIRWMNASTDLSPEWVNAISRWWFVLVLSLLAVVVIRWAIDWIRSRVMPKIHVIDVFFLLVCAIAVISTLFSPNKGAGFTSLRGYLQPMAVCVLARAIHPSKEHLRTLLILLLIVGVIMVAFEFWQVFGWTEADYRAHGYVRQNGELVTPTIQVRGQPYIRPTSTVSGPNELGVSMLLLSMGAFFGALYFDGRLRILLGWLTPIFLLGVMLTFSRSAFLGLIAAIIAATILLIKPQLANNKEMGGRRGYKTLAFIAGLVILVILVLVVSGNLRHISNTLSHLTQEYHIRDSLDAARFLIENPGGVGMGMVEPKGALTLMAAESLYHVEGSLFQIAIEMSILGLVIWLAFWCVGLMQIWQMWGELKQPGLRVLTGTAFAGWIGALVAFVFLPLMQSISLMVWLWFFFGFALESQRIESMWEDRDRIASSSTPTPT
ncbi:MAG: hypothetical protein WBB65_15015 [Anaerolineales bacterium]